ncbi:MAG: multiheme c-type cytochrome [Thermoanaerobaculia bacterium]|nr:multiheme c-type cytochrome [Thermoanaerobaculia bacterium]
MPRARRRRSILVAISAAVLLGGVTLLFAWEPLAVSDDPLVRMPGTQPADGVSLEAPDRCLNCHADYDSAVEPGFNWQGSMMAQAARDFLFFSCLTVAAQDSIWAIGRPNATDICLRCHSPAGWLGGRSDPTNASALTGADFDGVSCDSCHRQYDPFFQTTWDGSREGSDWVGYWDETDASATPSSPAADETHTADAAEASLVDLFNGLPFYESNLPHDPAYTEAGSGQYFVSTQSDKRASFADAAAKHKMLYSRFHKSKYFCSTCHDVSNPVLANLAFDGTPPGDGSTVLPTEENPAYAYLHVERTFSEFMLSDYGLQGGAPGIGPFDPSVFETSLANNWIARCQDCHMRDVTGVACDKTGSIVRPDGSVEHPKSGLPLHDLTGGNAWVPWVLASTVPGSPNYDAVNESLLDQGPAVLTLDLTQGLALDPTALLDAVTRAKQQLAWAAAIQNLAYDPATGAVSLRIQNQTGHKLISGFPEGRRMFLNIRVYSEETLIWEVNPYDQEAGTLKGLGATYSDPDGTLPEPRPLASVEAYEDWVVPDPQPLGPNEVYEDALVFEVHPSSSLTGESKSFHFALADGRYKDNRIPPKGFRIDEAASRLSVPAWTGQEDPDYFTAAEYAGGYDDIEIDVATGGDEVEVHLYYQTTSREYVEFLRDEINGSASTLDSPTPSGEPEAYIVQSDPWFGQLKAWGTTLWSLWKHNKDVDGAAPVEMAEAELQVGTFTHEPTTPPGGEPGPAIEEVPSGDLGPDERQPQGPLVRRSREPERAASGAPESGTRREPPL